MTNKALENYPNKLKKNMHKLADMSFNRSCKVVKNSDLKRVVEKPQ